MLHPHLVSQGHMVRAIRANTRIRAANAEAVTFLDVRNMPVDPSPSTISNPAMYHGRQGIVNGALFVDLKSTLESSRGHIDMV